MSTSPHWPKPTLGFAHSRGHAPQVLSSHIFDFSPTSSRFDWLPFCTRVAWASPVQVRLYISSFYWHLLDSLHWCRNLNPLILINTTFSLDERTMCNHSNNTETCFTDFKRQFQTDALLSRETRCFSLFQGSKYWFVLMTLFFQSLFNCRCCSHFIKWKWSIRWWGFSWEWQWWRTR